MVKNLTDNELLEILAALEHDRWSRWMEYMLTNMSPENLERWKRQMITDYKDLSEKEKESDRKEARITLTYIDVYLNG